VLIQAISGVVSLIASVTVSIAAANPDGTGTLVILNKSEASASIVDRDTGRVLATLPTGQGPHEAVVSPDGKTAVGADYGEAVPGDTLTVIDLPTLRVVRTIELGHHRPHGIWYLPDGERVVVTCEQERRVLLVNVREGKVEKAIPTGADGSHMLALSPDADEVYVANIGSGSATIIDLARGEKVATIPTGRGAEGIDVSPDGKEVWVSNRGADTVSVIDTASRRVVEQLECPDFPIRVKFTPDGKHVLVSCARSGDVAVFDAGAKALVRRVTMLEEGGEDGGGVFNTGPVPIGILIPPDGAQAYIANTNADIVTVIDLATWKITDRLKAGKTPDGMAWSPLELGDG